MARLDIISGWHLTTVRLYRDRWLRSLHIANGCDSQQDFINDRLRCRNTYAAATASSRDVSMKC